MKKLEDRPWWPELVELKDVMSLRELSARFGAAPAAISNALKRNNMDRNPAPPGPRDKRDPSLIAKAQKKIDSVSGRGDAPKATRGGRTAKAAKAAKPPKATRPVRAAKSTRVAKAPKAPKAATAPKAPRKTGGRRAGSSRLAAFADQLGKVIDRENRREGGRFRQRRHQLPQTPRNPGGQHRWTSPRAQGRSQGGCGAGSRGQGGCCAGCRQVGQGGCCFGRSRWLRLPGDHWQHRVRRRRSQYRRRGSARAGCQPRCSVPHRAAGKRHYRLSRPVHQCGPRGKSCAGRAVSAACDSVDSAEPAQGSWAGSSSTRNEKAPYASDRPLAKSWPSELRTSTRANGTGFPLLANMPLTGVPLDRCSRPRSFVPSSPVGSRTMWVTAEASLAGVKVSSTGTAGRFMVMRPSDSEVAG